MTASSHLDEQESEVHGDTSSEYSSATQSSQLVIRPSAKAVKKRWHTKVRTGCDMCKKRRIKCDELKPACWKCTRKGLKCPGYNPPAVRLFELSDGPDDFDSPMDKAAYDVFIARGSRIFAISNNTSMKLWMTTIPQLAYRFKAVRHAIIGIGAVQKQALVGEQFPIPETTMIQRSRTMQELYKSDPSQITPEVMAACAMFLMVLDIWTESGGGPAFHLNAAYRFLHEHCERLRSQGLPASREIQQLFFPAINYSIVTSLSVVDEYPPPSSPIPVNYKLLLDLPLVDNFANFSDALYSLDRINKAAARYSFGHKAPGIETNLSIALTRYRDQVSRLFNAGQLDSSSVDRNISYEAYLSAHWRATKFIFESAEYTSESLFSPLHDDVFAQIIDSIAIWLNGEILIPARERIPNLGVIPPLFLVATKCRNSRLRRKALRLLHAASRSERGWNTCIATLLAQVVIDAEERTVEDLPASAIMPVGMAQDRQQVYVCLDKVDIIPPEGRMSVRYWKQKLSDGVLQSRQSVKVSVEYDSESGVLAPLLDPLTSKVLRAYGYSGIILLAPRIPCQCLGRDTITTGKSQDGHGRGFVSYVIMDDAENPSDPTNSGEPNYQQPRGFVVGSGGWFQWRPEGFTERSNQDGTAEWTYHPSV